MNLEFIINDRIRVMGRPHFAAAHQVEDGRPVLARIVQEFIVAPDSRAGGGFLSIPV